MEQLCHRDPEEVSTGTIKKYFSDGAEIGCEFRGQIIHRTIFWSSKGAYGTIQRVAASGGRGRWGVSLGDY